MVNVGSWYDPISECWIAPRPSRPEMAAAAASPDLVAEHQRNVEVQRIWRALVACCARN
jgi:hypothetical protein